MRRNTLDRQHSLFDMSVVCSLRFAVYSHYICLKTNLSFIPIYSKKLTKKLKKIWSSMCAWSFFCQQPASEGIEAKRAVLLTRIFCLSLLRKTCGPQRQWKVIGYKPNDGSGGGTYTGVCVFSNWRCCCYLF